ncbi:cytochrome C [Geomesophilobacter sediminis]|uniref:Cytochrome C n=1 Tax=Geomesophilobacter sediminis TaxID=2798584 RepID=A0A8J7M3T6_9BACT|nr:cytochrome C [Geomesophilobacter sediminis]MBJ6727681.1 cytochrome C [Geomesophilobacter sediminis]
MKSRTLLAVLTFAVALAPLLRPGTAHAIPAFARQHNTECSTCHTIYPELNEFGDAFLKNGYVYPGKPRAAEAPAEGAPAKPRSEGLWLAGIPEQIPISFTGTLNVTYDKDASDKDQLDLAARALRLQAGGAFREAAGFFVTYNLYSQGTQNGAVLTPNTNRPDIDELYALWRHALGTPVNFRIGRMEPKLSLWKRSDRLIPVPSFASTAYTVGRSQFSVDSRSDALEANAILGNRVFVAGGVVDRKGQNTKDGYGHISVKFGGTDLKGQEPELDLEQESVWDYLSLTLGGFYYVGRDADIAGLNGIGQNGNRFYRAGTEADLIYKRLRLKGSGVFGADRNPDFTPVRPAADNETHAFAFEGEYLFGAPVNFAAVLRYELQDDAVGVTRRYIPAIVYAPLQNVRTSLQYNYEVTPERRNRITLASLSFSF